MRSSSECSNAFASCTPLRNGPSQGIQEDLFCSNPIVSENPTFMRWLKYKKCVVCLESVRSWNFRKIWIVKQVSLSISNWKIGGKHCRQGCLDTHLLKILSDPHPPADSNFSAKFKMAGLRLKPADERFNFAGIFEEFWGICTKNTTMPKT